MSFTTVTMWICVGSWALLPIIVAAVLLWGRHRTPRHPYAAQGITGDGSYDNPFTIEGDTR